MADFELIASTMRSGVAVDEVRFEVADAPAAHGYLLGRQHDGPQPLVIGLHDGRGDKGSMLGDLGYLAARGFVCLSIDSPVTRRAMAARDPLTAFTSQLAIARTALNVLHDDPNVQPRRIAAVGRGMGGEVAAYLAATTGDIQAVVATESLLDRSSFVKESPHALAAGLRVFLDEDAIAAQVAGLRPTRLIDQLTAANGTHWMLQVADDDDRISDSDHATLSLTIPRTVRVEHVAHARDLSAKQARRARIDFISRMCG